MSKVTRVELHVCKEILEKIVAGIQNVGEEITDPFGQYGHRI